VPREGPAASTVAPPGWPGAVRPPGVSDWEPSAVNWLLDICPGLRRHPAILARFAVLHTEASQAAIDRGLSEARGFLRDVAGEAEIAAAITVWEREKARLIGVRRAVGLLEEALRGQRYVSRMS
jgi:hypothetical protein